MAAGDITWFDQALLDLGKKVHDLSSETIKLGLIDDSVSPSASADDPRWGSGGTTNYSTTEVATGTAYTGPVTLANSSWTIASGRPVFDADNVSILQDAGGFDDARWGIIYNDTAAGKQALAFVDLGSNRSIQSGPLAINWNVAGIIEIDRVV